MPLRAGTRLGPHEIVSFIGAGGMGEVYEARDTRLDRRVAIKVLPSDLANDPEFRARFAREARAISALNHPHICGLHDIGREHETDYLVLELLEGETLAARLARGALPLNQVLRFGAEIADALEAAHRHGIVHRDLKPGNVMLTPAGTKLLDFGLAKSSVGPAAESLSALATATGSVTAEGTIVGTLQYMAPEQVQGHQADARTDLFALGAVLYEMATGRKAFAGSTRASVLAKILETHPQTLSSTVPMAPIAFEHLVQVCLAKDPGERWQNARDVALQLRWIQHHQSTDASTATITDGRAKWREWIAWSVAIIAVATAGWLLVRPTSRVDRPGTATRTDILLPPRLYLHDWFDFPAVSPDGGAVVFAGSADGIRRLYVRPMNAAVFRPLPGTEGAFGPFWSPDNRIIGFFVGTSIRRVDVAAGGVVTIGDYDAKGMTMGRTGALNAEGTVLFGLDGPIWRAGERGAAIAVTRVDPRHTDRHHFLPQFLPDGRFLYSDAGTPRTLFVGSLQSTGGKRIAVFPGAASYAAGHLLYVRQRTLIAQPFDPVGLRIQGAPFPVADGVVEENFSASQNGTIVYRPVESEFASLVWFDRHGARLGTLGEQAEYRQLALSPSGTRVVVARGAPSDSDLWIADSERGVFSRLTHTPGSEHDPTWSPDERYIAYSFIRAPDANATQQRDGVRRLDLVTAADKELAPSTCEYVDEWTNDNHFVICRGNEGLAAVPTSGPGAPIRLLRDSEGDQWHVSADGRWIAYNSAESGESEVYVAPFPQLRPARQVSAGGGMQPLWRRDGRELFYLTSDGTVMSVGIRTAPAFEAETPKPLFKTNLIPADGWQQYSVTPDGQRFLVKEPVRQFFTVLQNWLPGGRQ